jgi:hypothetical protein
LRWPYGCLSHRRTHCEDADDLAPGERILTTSEGVNEVIAIADVPDEGRQLLTNGHPMSSTNPMSQRYMRALAHIRSCRSSIPPTASS